MADATVNHVGFTLLATGGGGTTDESNADSHEMVRGLNDKMGGKKIFNAHSKEDTRPETTNFKVADGYAAATLSMTNGAAVFGDLGFDVLKLESPHADVGLGFRVDTGVNIGKKGVRICFLGMGGEVVTKPPAQANGKSQVCGFAVEFAFVKIKIVWDTSYDTSV